MSVAPPDDELVLFLRAVASCVVPDATWRGWTTQHEDALVQRFGRNGYLRLKFSPREAIPPVLTDLGIPFDREALDLFLQPAARGQAWDAIPGDAFGVRALIRRGETSQAREVIRDQLRRITNSANTDGQLPNEGDVGQALSEVVFDALQTLEHADRDPAFCSEGVCVLEAVTALEMEDDLTDPALRQARTALTRLHAELGAHPEPKAVAVWARRRGGFP